MKTKEELDQIREELKKTNPDYYEMIVGLDWENTDLRTVFLRRPNRQNYINANRLSMSQDPYKAIEHILYDCYLGGDDRDEILKSDDAILNAELSISIWMQRNNAVIKKN